MRLEHTYAFQLAKKTSPTQVQVLLLLEILVAWHNERYGSCEITRDLSRSFKVQGIPRLVRALFGLIWYTYTHTYYVHVM